MRIVFMGTPEFAVPPLEELIRQKHQVVAVYTRPDKPAGRSRQLMASPVKRVALRYGLPVVQPLSLKSPEEAATLVSFQPEVIVVAAYGQILPPSILDIPEYGCVNIHPSLLPRHRGPSPVAAAILAGDEVSGVTFMLMDAGMDTGPIIAQEKVAVSPQDTTGSLTMKLAEVSAKLLPHVLKRLVAGELPPQPQNHAEASYSRLITKEDGEIDWRLPAVVLWRRVRAFQPWPGAYTRWRKKKLEIIEAVPVLGQANAGVGQVVALEQGDAAFGVGTGEGILGVLKVQMEGKQEITAAEFLRGQRQFVGSILPS